jgi:hypothetical protein
LKPSDDVNPLDDSGAEPDRVTLVFRGDHFGSLPSSPMIIEALKERGPDEVCVLWCTVCTKLTYYNQGSHCTCEHCDADLTDLTDGDADEVLTLDGVWDSWFEAPDVP